LKKLDFGQTISILANAGVVAGIIFLAIEIQQNTVIQETQMRFSQNERYTETIEDLFRNSDLREAFLKHEAGELLTREEDLLLSAYAARVFVSWQWIYGEIERGTMPLEVLPTFRTSFHGGPHVGRDSSLFSDYWGRLDRSKFDPEFSEWMEENVVNER
jgi:hypothetical protein